LELPAVTTIGTSTTVGLMLGFPPDVNPVVIDPGEIVSNSGNAVYASSGSWTIENSGTISSADIAGVYLCAGRSITNAATAAITGIE
jgi:hypothetical protein